MKPFKILLALLVFFSPIALLAQDAGKPGKPYEIHDRSSKVSRIDVRKDSKRTDNIIQLDATNASGGANLATKSTALEPANITGVNIVAGSYNQTRELARTSRGMSLQLLDVVYPCRLRVTVSDQLVDIEIKEAGFWKVSIGLIN